MTTTLYGPTWQLDTWQGNVTDDNAVDWIVSSEDGWSSTPAIRGDSSDLPGGDGGYDTNPLYGPRVISLSGSAVGPDSSTIASAKRQFAALLEASRGGTLTVTEGEVVLSCAVRPSGPFRVTDTAPYAFDWQMQLTAPDPRKYGPSVEQTTGMAASSGGLSFPVSFPADFGTSTSGAVFCANDGTVASWPVLRITGPVVNPRVWNPDTGDGLTFALTIGAGEYVDVDTGARTVLYQGAASRRSTVSVSGRWVPVLPGGSQLSWGADTYSASAFLTVTSRSAWI